MICVAIKIHLFRLMKPTQKLNFIFLLKFSIKVKSSERDTVFLLPQNRNKQGNNKNRRQLQSSSSSLHRKESWSLELVPGFAF